MTKSYNTYSLPSEQHTKGLAESLAKTAKKGDVFLLSGDLGMGKTTFARFFIRELMEDDTVVTSPTFTLIQTYDAPQVRVYHADLYRLVSPEEVFELGLEEAFEKGITLIEWPERLGAMLPRRRIEISFTEQKEGRAANLRIVNET